MRELVKIGVWGGLLLAAVEAGAQQRSDVMPAPEKPALGSPAQTLYPSLAAQAPTPATEHGATKALPEGHGRGEAVVDWPSSAEESVRDQPMPEYHLVAPGDTLSNIAGAYFQNPGFWPKLWSLNPSITNPHWIFPGDRIRLAPPGAPEPTPVTKPSSEPETPRFARPPPRELKPTLLRQNGFVEPGQLDAASTVIGARDEKMMLSTLDQAYIDYSEEQPLKRGDHYSVYHVLSHIKHPTTGRMLGAVVEIVGEVEVQGEEPTQKARAGHHIARALIVEARNPIERGYRVGPLDLGLKLVDPVVDKVDVDGMIVGAMQPIQLVSSEMLVFLDRGSQEGVEAGNRFVVVRRGDGYKHRLNEVAQQDPHFPEELIGEILAIDVRPHTLTGLVTRSIRELQIGDRVEARKGF